MRDDFLTADWGSNHAKMSNGIHKLFTSIRDAFASLHAQQFAAPWNDDAAEVRNTSAR